MHRLKSYIKAQQHDDNNLFATYEIDVQQKTGKTTNGNNNSNWRRTTKKRTIRIILDRNLERISSPQRYCQLDHEEENR